MNFNEEQLINLINEFCINKDIELSDIPCVDLYMDQVTSFFDDKLCDLKRNEEDKILTKTMINNYSKAKILMPIKNKKYTQENIILLTIIYNLKQVLSINDISTLLKPLLNELKGQENNEEYIEKIYSEFLKIKKSREQNMKKNINENLKDIKDVNLGLEDEKENRAKLLLMVFLLINGATIQKRMAEKIIDTFFINRDS